MFTEEFIIKAKYDLNELLFRLDPMGLGTIENDSHDEYTNESDEIIEEIIKELNSKKELNILTLRDLCKITIKNVFTKNFSVFALALPIADYYVECIAIDLCLKFKG